MTEFIIEKFNNDNTCAAVLEYDKETLYLYLCDFVDGQMKIVDAINVKCRGIPEEKDYNIIWDGQTVNLYRNSELVASIK